MDKEHVNCKVHDLSDGTRIVQFEHSGAKIEVVEDPPEWGNPGLVGVYVVDEFTSFPDA